MSGTQASKKPLNTGRELLFRSIDELNKFGHGDVGGNVSKYPTVVVFLGSKASEYFEQVKQPLDDNWNNAMHLEYLQVYPSGDGFACKKLVRNEDDPTQADWSEELDDFAGALNDSVVTMLGKDEKVFSDSSAVKFDFILDATEEKGHGYYELYRDLKCIINITKFKTLYLMIDQNPANVKASDHLLQEILNDEKLDSPNVYLISNQQKNKKFLLKDRIWLNYRLIANLIILAANKNFTGTNYALNIGIKTVSYAIVPKPTDQIGEVAMDTLLNEMYNMESRRYVQDGQTWTVARFKERIGMDVDNTIEMANNLLIEVFSTASAFRADAVYYLPYTTDKDLDELQKDKSYNLKMIDARCSGAASAYINCNCKQPILDYFEKEDRPACVRRDIKNFLMSRFNFFELQQLRDLRGEITQCILQPVTRMAAMPADIRAAFEIQAKRESKELFYQMYKNVLAEVINDLLDEVEAYDQNYKQICREMRNERIGNGDEEQSIEEFYQRVVRDYITEKQNFSQGPAFPRVFNMDLDKAGILQEILNQYCEMIKWKTVFSLDFEQEIKERSEHLNAVAQMGFVQSELIKQIEGSMRLNNVIGLQAMKQATYYLINDQAEYAAKLRSASGYATGDYLLFNLNRTDCIEQLEIYLLQDTKLIHLLDDEEM